MNGNGRRKLVLGQVVVLGLALVGGPAMTAPEQERADVPVRDGCKKLPRDKRMVKLDLKPDSAIADLVNTYALLTCKRVRLSGDLSAQKVSPKLPRLITVDELNKLVKDEAKKAGLRYVEDEASIFVSP